MRADPMARRTEHPPSNASVVDESTHVWADDVWLARRDAAAEQAAAGLLAGESRRQRLVVRM
jgi:1,4-alpha-glucan branching enzyme